MSDAWWPNPGTYGEQKPGLKVRGLLFSFLFLATLPMSVLDADIRLELIPKSHQNRHHTHAVLGILSEHPQDRCKHWGTFTTLHRHSYRQDKACGWLPRRELLSVVCSKYRQLHKAKSFFRRRSSIFSMRLEKSNLLFDFFFKKRDILKSGIGLPSFLYFPFAG